MSEILIAGIGSPHGADRLGWAVIDALRQRNLPQPVRLASCAQPGELSVLLLEAAHAIVLDAMLGSGPAGRIHRLAIADLPDVAQKVSSHGIGLREAIRLAAALGFEPDRLSLIALDVVEAEAALELSWIEALADEACQHLFALTRQRG